MKQTPVEYLWQKLWKTPKDKDIWYEILIECKEIEDSKFLLYGFKCFIKGVLSVIVGILIALFI
jgi:hypothetical protein